MNQRYKTKIEYDFEGNISAIKGFFEDYRWLSNFHLCPIEMLGVVWPSSENIYQFLKLDVSKVSSDKFYEIKNKFRDCTPAQSKKYGKSIPLEPKWDLLKYEVMENIVFKKFEQNYDLKCKLLKTEDAYLEETNTWKDVYWGVCNGKGENNLGKILMQTRNHFRGK